MNRSVKTKILILGCLLLLLGLGCKEQSFQDDSKTLALSTTLDFENDLKYLEDGECLVEFKENLRRGQSLSIGTAAQSVCIESEAPRLLLRGRIDIDQKKDPGKLALSIIMDSSGSLKQTDPNRLKDSALTNFLTKLGKAYKDKPEHLRIKVIFTGFCELSQYTKVFSGNTVAEYNSFVKSIVFPAIKYQTNYINAMQSASDFLRSSENSLFDKNVVLFSDGMPWSKGVRENSVCSGVVSEIKNKLAGGTNIDLTTSIAGCSGLYGAEKSQTICEDTIVNNGLSQVGLLPELDPVNAVLAMKQHVDFASNNFAANDIGFHSVFLKSNTCWEEKNSTGVYKQRYSYLCNDVAQNQLFQKMSSGNGKNLLISDAKNLDDAFSSLFTGLMQQYELASVALSTQNGIVAGEVCNQKSGAVNCPIGAKKVGGFASTADESGAFNFHIPASDFTAQMNTTLKAVLKDSGESVDFDVSTNLTSSGSSCSAYKDVGKYIENGSEHKIVQNDAADVRISCKRVRYLGCVTETGVKVADGQSMGKKSCVNYPRCGETTVIEQVCKDAVPAPLFLACPSSTKTVEECKPISCKANEIVPVAGKEDQVYSLAGRASGDASSCEDAIKFKCSNGLWRQMIAGSESCFGGCAANSAVSRSGADGEKITIDSFSVGASTNCLGEKKSTEFMCKGSSWVKIGGESVGSKTCKEVSSRCSNPETCGGTIYSAEGSPVTFDRGDGSSGAKTSTVVGKRL